MIIILVLSRPFANAVALVDVIALPMMFANSAGAALFVSIIRDQKNMYDKFGAIFSARALKVAERTLGLLSKGFTPETPDELANIIHQETGVGAVAITDREKVLAFVGIGSDHHQPRQSDLFGAHPAGHSGKQGHLSPTASTSASPAP